MTHAYRTLLRIVLPLLLLCLPLTSCAENTPYSFGMNGETSATPYHVKYNANVHSPGPQIYVQPTSSPNQAPTALFVPLRVTQNMQQARSLALGVSRQIWNVWLEQGAFAALEFYDGAIPHQVKDALGVARRRGAQLLVGGYINQIMDGGVTGVSSLSLHIEVYEVATGAQLWSISQAGSIEKVQPTDLFLVGVEQRMPRDPMSVLIQAIGYDLGLQIAAWINPQAYSAPGMEGIAF